eukprot:13955009-Alexandrium_andersonii.AAC.1
MEEEPQVVADAQEAHQRMLANVRWVQDVVGCGTAVAKSSGSFESQLVDPPNGRPGEPPREREMDGQWR